MSIKRSILVAIIAGVIGAIVAGIPSVQVAVAGRYQSTDKTIAKVAAIDMAAAGIPDGVVMSKKWKNMSLQEQSDLMDEIVAYLSVDMKAKKAKAKKKDK